ncbi:hypothetical protein [Alteromonas sp. KUL49]|uniref:hypothetical protein n=1 Tax=Alteromonas sp. KUL49 TaxID=2480798 RepID=UPI0010FFAD2A|nr:hypothetical protein [Alteromonas sp. KUL49]GEA13561.1 hypothetical protein KUL49_39360 [Alteromonas sp. KUL49]
MIIAAGVIGLLVLLLIYFVLRAQTLQRELALSRSSAKQSSNQVNHAYRNLVMVTESLEKVLAVRIEKAQQRRLISQQQYTVLSTLLQHFSAIIMYCCEKGATLEEALNHELRSEEIGLEEIKNIMKDMPSSVRLAWSKNSAEGFIAACQLVTASLGGKTKKKAVKRKLPKKVNMLALTQLT